MILNQGGPPSLETERLRLEPFTLADAERHYPIMGDSEVVVFWDAPEVDDPDMVTELVRGKSQAMQAGRAIHWTM